MHDFLKLFLVDDMMMVIDEWMDGMNGMDGMDE